LQAEKSRQSSNKPADLADLADLAALLRVFALRCRRFVKRHANCGTAHQVTMQITFLGAYPRRIK
jgi:hypothetical protein